MICLICRQAETIDGFTSVNFERGEMRLLIKNVPAQLCPSCGDAYMAENIAIQLLQDAEEMSARGEFESETEFVRK
jgi:YgiT-type zinc finger domain-containing protein